MAKRLDLDGWLSAARANDATDGFVELTEADEAAVQQFLAKGCMISSDLSTCLYPGDAGYDDAVTARNTAMAASAYVIAKNDAASAAPTETFADVLADEREKSNNANPDAPGQN